MRPVLAAALIAALFLVAAAPNAQAAINRPRAFDEAFPYMPALDSSEKTVVSGQVDADIKDATASYGFFDAQGTDVTGLSRVCWQLLLGCRDSDSRSLSLSVAPGGSFAVCFPAATSGILHADHALALFVDLAQDDDLNSFRVDKSLVAPVIDGTYTFSNIAPITTVAATSQACTVGGGLVGLDADMRLSIRDGAQVVATLSGKDARVSFAGQPAVSTIAADFVIVPFTGASTSSFKSSSDRDAERGLDLNRVQELIRALDASHEGSTVDRGQQDSGGNNTQAVLAGLLNGAFVRGAFPTEGEPFPFKDIHFVRFSHMTVDPDGETLAWEGKAYLEVKDGKVAKAPNLVGFWLFQLPWWSYLLWAAAITLAILKIVLKPDKNHPRWDTLRWIGWVATPVAWIIVFFLWDAEMHAVLGASLLRGSSGQFRLIVGALQLGLLSIVAFAAAAPLRVIGRNSFMLAHQGTFMGLAGSIAAILGFLFGAPYLRSYLGLILTKVMERLA
ncbi:MAG: hypothetical protein AABY18_01475 [Candidatus Thermoplasmatota archaeon]